MAIDPTPLPYDPGALEPHIPAATVELQQARHRAHVEALGPLLAGTPLAGRPLADVVRAAEGPAFQHAAQAWNIAFFFRGMKPAAAGGGGDPAGTLAAAVAQRHGDAGRLRAAFNDAALRIFGSGWAWLVQRPGGDLAVATTHAAATPLTGDDTPLLACNLWEHAWLADHREGPARYLDAFWQVVDWQAVAARLRAG